MQLFKAHLIRRNLRAHLFHADENKNFHVFFPLTQDYKLIDKQKKNKKCHEITRTDIKKSFLHNFMNNTVDSITNFVTRDICSMAFGLDQLPWKYQLGLVIICLR